MNFKFEEDLENNLLLLTVSSELRTRLNQPRVRCDIRSAQRLVKENYTCLKTHVLGECVNPIQLMDNNHSDSCSIVWKFKLIPKEKQSHPTSPTKRARTKKKKISTTKSKDE
jgi:hypothetical protein